jgi:heme-degrading monooxygenase HmoA
LIWNGKDYCRVTEGAYDCSNFSNKFKTMIAQTPKPPYYAVIFTSIKTADDHGYEEMSKMMVELAALQDGFLGMESTRNELGITVSYWKDLESIRKWKENSDHSLAREMGRANWYQYFKTRIVLVERDYGFERI